jgi:hypothetical protein
MSDTGTVQPKVELLKGLEFWLRSDCLKAACTSQMAEPS